MATIKTPRMLIMGFHNGKSEPLFKVEVNSNDGFAWSDSIHRLFSDSTVDYLVFEPVTISDFELF